MTLKAGTAVIDISPEKPMFLVGYPHVERTSEGIHECFTHLWCGINDEQKITTLAHKFKLWHGNSLLIIKTIQKRQSLLVIKRFTI